MQDVWYDSRLIEDEVLFERYNITGYSTSDSQLCCSSSNTSSDSDTGPDDHQGFLGDQEGHSGS